MNKMKIEINYRRVRNKIPWYKIYLFVHSTLPMYHYCHKEIIVTQKINGFEKCSTISTFEMVKICKIICICSKLMSWIKLQVYILKAHLKARFWNIMAIQFPRVDNKISKSSSMNNYKCSYPHGASCIWVVVQHESNINVQEVCY